MPREFFLLVYIVVLAFSLNILFTLKQHVDDVGIRVGLTDFLIPIGLIIFGIHFIRTKDCPELISEHIWKLLALMSIWMLISLINGYIYIGELINWALVNKFAGWFILISYFCVGVHLGTLSKENKILFFKILLVTNWIICIAEIFTYWVFSHGFFHQYQYIANHYRMVGFYQNPNAFGIYLSVIFMLQLFMIRENLLFRKTVMIISSSMILLCVYYSYSRSAWLGLFLGVISLVYLERKLIVYVGYSVIIALIMNVVIYSDYTKNKNEELIEYFYPGIQKVIDYYEESTIYFQKRYENERNIVLENIDKIESVVSDKKSINIKSQDIELEEKKIDKKDVVEISIKDRISLNGHADRISIIKRSLSYWLDSPILGIGLGGHIWNSLKENINSNDVTIHSSPNWLLVETGLIGFFIFSLFIFICIKSLLIDAKSDIEYLSPQAMIGIIIIMLGASVGTEVLYQRYLWLLLGLFMFKKNNKWKS